jgi:hypothetical protein
MLMLLRGGWLRWLRVVLGVASLGLISTSTAWGASRLDTVTVTGSGGTFSGIDINAQSGTSGQNPSGTASFTASVTILGRTFLVSLSGPVTCLSVTGPDQGAGTPTSPTTAFLTFISTSGALSGDVTPVEVVDNGGNGEDLFIPGIPSAGGNPSVCGPVGLPSTQLTGGRAVVFDAPLLPTSKDQCKDGGWLNFPQFKNQGNCVSFVASKGKNQPG